MADLVYHTSVAIIGDRPETGIRLDIERPRGDAPPFRFDGFVVDPSQRRQVCAVIDANGDVEVTMVDGDAELVEKIRLLVRTACKHARAEGRAPPLRIQRWRGEK